MPRRLLFLLLIAVPAAAQQSSPQKTIGRITLADARDVKFTGAVSVDEGTMAVGNGSIVTAATRTTHVKLARGGSVNVCATTSVQMTQAGESIMLSLDHGAVESRYSMENATTSDVVQTPDLRISIAAPGASDVRVRVNGRGDTCVENHGSKDAPYVTVTPQLGDGLYRVEGGQRVMFERGDLREVVDHEPYPCGCPPDEAPKPEEFPLAVSQGLTPPPAPPTKPVAAPGEVHAQVSASLIYNSEGVPPQDSENAADAVANPAAIAAVQPRTVPPLAPVVLPPARPQSPPVVSAPPPVVAQVSPQTPQVIPPAQWRTTAARREKPNDLVHFVGRFFSKLFGRPRAVTY